MTPELPAGHEWCTTTSRRKRYISNNLLADRHAPRRKGRAGRTLCGTSGEDEDRANYWRDLWGGTRKEFTIANLPPCAPCTRKAAKLAA